MEKQNRMILKSLLLTVAIGLFVTVLSASSQMRKSQNPEVQTLEIQTKDCQYGQCSKIKADGTRCKNCAQRYSPYCWSHRK